MQYEMQEKPFFIYHTLKIQKLPGLCPEPRWGAHDAPPDPLVVWGGRPSPHPSPSAPLAPRFLRGAFGAYFIYLSGPPLSKILDPPLSMSQFTAVPYGDSFSAVTIFMQLYVIIIYTHNIKHYS